MEMYTYKINLIVTTKISADNSRCEYKSVRIIVHVAIYGYDA